MKYLLTVLLSLIFFVSRAQFLPAFHHAPVVPSADTCISKVQIMMAKAYVDDLETRYQKAQQRIGLLEFQVQQRGERNQALESQNEGLRTDAEDYQRHRKITGWVGAVLGAAGGIIGTLIFAK